MRDQTTAYVALGANLGQPAQAIGDAIERLGELPGTTVTACSSLYRTAPLDASGPDYINAVAEISTNLPAPDLLAHLQALELQAGRERPYPNAPRTLDLDLLLYGGGRIDSPRLQVPHPRMNDRAFVLVPLAELAPHLVPQDSLRRVSGQVLARFAVLPPR
jgi:2-amino-4-hydroxy-6-hydroxymethyldihydropteridine diphosphokinase